MSDIRGIGFGVPQGSVLEPMLFIMCMDDIHNIPFRDAEAICYADTAIIFHGTDQNHATRNADHCL